MDIPLPLLLLPMSIFALALLVNFDAENRKESAEFEAKNCPEMLKIESEFCKPLEDK